MTRTAWYQHSPHKVKGPQDCPPLWRPATNRVPRLCTTTPSRLITHEADSSNSGDHYNDDRGFSREDAAQDQPRGNKAKYGGRGTELLCLLGVHHSPMMPSCLPA